MSIGWTRSFFFVTALVACLGFSRVASAVTKVACVGDSITQRSGWCEDLGTLLGPNYAVQNDGLSGTTLLKAGDNPYWNCTQFASSKAFAPDIVIIMLGTNDSKPQNWAKGANFEADYKALIAVYQALPSLPRVLLNICPPAGVNSYNISGTVIENEVIPLIKKVAADTCVGLIDVFSAMGGHTLNASYFSATDQVHPNAAGAQKIADTVYAALQADRADAGRCVPVAADAGLLDASSEAAKDAQPAADVMQPQDSAGSAGAGGSTGAAGAGGTSGAGAGGATAAGGSSGASGAGGAAGTTWTGGGAGAPPVGGSAGTTGSTNAAAPAENAGNCNCSFASRPNGRWAAVLLSLVALVRRSRRRRH
jgi:acyl-CoA thioesterase I